MGRIHPLGIIFAVVTLLVSAAMVIPFLIIAAEFFLGNRKESLLYEILTHDPHEYQPNKR